MNETNPVPLLTKLRDFLWDIQRSEMWYRDNEHNPDCRPALPRRVKQGPNDFIVTAHGEAYKRELLRTAGIPTIGRPRKDHDPPTAPE